MLKQFKKWAVGKFCAAKEKVVNLYQTAKTKLMVGATGLALAGGAAAQETGPDLSSLTSQINFGTVIVALLAVAAALAGVYIAWKGAKMILAAIRGG